MNDPSIQILPPKKILIKSCVLLTAISFLFFLIPNRLIIAQQSATDEAIPQELIKENLKERLEKVVKDESKMELLKRAWVGSLKTIANHTLTIDTREGPKLASISAQTSFLLLPKRAQISAEDLEIGSHTIAIGFLNGNQVLDTRRIIINEEPPETPKRQVHFVTIEDYDSRKDLLVVRLPSQESQIVELTEDTEISQGSNGDIFETSSERLESGLNSVIIVEIEVENDSETRNLLKIHLLPQSEEEIEETAIPVEIDTRQATESSNL